MKRFNVRTETGVIKALADILCEKNEVTEEEVINLPFVGITNIKRTIYVKAKTEESKRILSRFIPKDKADICPYPKAGEGTKGWFEEHNLITLMITIHRIMELTSYRSFLLSVAKPGLLKIETHHFEFLLAHVDGEWK